MHEVQQMPTIERSDDGTLTVSSLTIAEGSGVQHKNVLELIHANVADLEEFGQLAFETRAGYNNAQVRIAHLNEQQAALVMTYQRNTDRVRAFKKALVKAFFEMAERLAAPSAALPSRRELAQWLIEAEDAKAALESKVKADAPKVLFADAVAASQTTILVGDLAKILRGNGAEIGANRLFELLRRDGFLIRREGTDRNMPTQRAMDLGLFKIKETVVTHSDGHTTISKTPKVTGKGQTYLIDRYAPRRQLALIEGELA